MKKTQYIASMLVIVLVFFSKSSLAVPSFARQTGMACSACHMIYPELTAFGRSFKLNGYTLTNIKQVEAKASSDASSLRLDQLPPLSAMLQITGTNTKSQDPATQISLPDQFSLFYAGAISPNMGSFIQATMGQGGNFEMDNTDIRYAKAAGNVTFGVTINNNPTVQDLWNSTPAWGFPYTAGAGVSAPIVADGLGQNVVGMGGYADWGNGVYSEITMYRDTNPFASPAGAAAVRIKGLAPYWRVAWDKNYGSKDELMLGTYGMQTSLYSNGSGTYADPADKFRDVAIDTQYTHTFTNSNAITAHASYTNEKQTRDLSGGGSATLKSLRIDGTYHWGYHVAATVAYATNSGDGALGNGSDDKAVTLQGSYLPWQNTKLTAQYVKYTEKGGVTGSAASDNDTLLLQAWLMW